MGLSESIVKRLREQIKTSRLGIYNFYKQNDLSASDNFLDQTCDEVLLLNKYKKHQWLLDYKQTRQGNLTNTIYIKQVVKPAEVTNLVYNAINNIIKVVPARIRKLKLMCERERTFEEWVNAYTFYPEIENGRLFIHDDAGQRYKYRYFFRTVLKRLITISDKDIEKLLKSVGKIEFTKLVPVTVSIDPYEFVVSSEYTTGWDTCFSLGGEHHLCTNSYSNSENILITYIKKGGADKNSRMFVGFKYLSDSPEDTLIFTSSCYGDDNYASDFRNKIYNILKVNRKDYKVSSVNVSNRSNNYFDNFKVSRNTNSLKYTEAIEGINSNTYDMFSDVYYPIALDGVLATDPVDHNLDTLTCPSCLHRCSELYGVNSEGSLRICEDCLNHRDRFYMCMGNHEFYDEEYYIRYVDLGTGDFYSIDYLEYEGSSEFIYGIDENGNNVCGSRYDYVFIQDTDVIIRVDEAIICELSYECIRIDDAIYIEDKNYHVHADYSDDYYFLEDLEYYVSEDYELKEIDGLYYSIYYEEE